MYYLILSLINHVLPWNFIQLSCAGCHFRWAIRFSSTWAWDSKTINFEVWGLNFNCHLLTSSRFLWTSFYWSLKAWPASWEICMQVRQQQLELDMEQETGSKLGKGYFKAVYCHPAYLTSMQSTSWEMPGWMNTGWNQDCWEKYQ